MPAPTCNLHQKLPNGRQQTFNISQAVTTIGRSRNNDIMIEDASISRLHARIENRNGVFYLVDNGSSNGSYINKIKVSEQQLKPDDKLILGKVEFTVQLTNMDAQSVTSTEPYAQPVFPPDAPTARTEGGPPNHSEPEATPAMSQAAIGPKQPPRRGPHSGQMTSPMPTQTPPEAKPAMHRPSYQDIRNLAAQGPSGATLSGKRLLALIFDGLVHLLLLIPGIFLAATNQPAFGAFVSGLGFLAGLLHVAIGWGRCGQTVGKYFLGLRVVPIDDPSCDHLPPTHLATRLLCYFGFSLLAGLPFVSVLFDEDGRGLHDKWANTKVIATQ